MSMQPIYETEIRIKVLTTEPVTEDITIDELATLAETPAMVFTKQVLESNPLPRYLASQKLEELGVTQSAFYDDESPLSKELIISLIDQGRTVHWMNTRYVAHKGVDGKYYVTCTNGTTVGAPDTVGLLDAEQNLVEDPNKFFVMPE